MTLRSRFNSALTIGIYVITAFSCLTDSIALAVLAYAIAIVLLCTYAMLAFNSGVLCLIVDDIMARGVPQAEASRNTKVLCTGMVLCALTVLFTGMYILFIIWTFALLFLGIGIVKLSERLEVARRT